MKNLFFSNKGFLLLEVLMALLILAIAFAAFMGAMSQVLRVSYRANHTMDSVSQIEPLLFEIESGVRADLASSGGKGELKDGSHYEIEVKEEGDLASHLTGSLSSRGEKGFLEMDILVLKAPIQ